jgi:hypothetical protein
LSLIFFMKQIVFLIALIFSLNHLYAQRHYVEDGRFRIMGGGISGEFSSSKDEENTDKKNVIKLNLSSLSNKIIGLQYERALTKNFSFALQGRYSLESNLPAVELFSNFIDDTAVVFKNLKISGWAITPEFRLYFRRALKGFYLAPYFRIRNTDISFPINYTDDFNKAQNITTKGSFLSYGGGLMIGQHFKIGKSVSLDIFIIGTHYMTTAIDITSNSSVTLSVNDQQDVRDFLATTQLSLVNLVKNFKYEVSSNKLTVQGSMNGVGIRGGGVNLGFRF